MDPGGRKEGGAEVMGIGDGSASERGESHSHSLTKQQLKNPPNEVLVRGSRSVEWGVEGGRMLRVGVDKNSARIRPPWPPPPSPAMVFCLA